MVGVPRSKGCSVCRERRIRCDQIRPQCTQCRRYGCPCPGYNRGFKFQDEGPGLERRHRRASRRLSNDAERTRMTITTTAGRSDSVHASMQDAMVMRRHAAVSIDETVSPSLVKKSFGIPQPQLFMDFIYTAFPATYFHNLFRYAGGPSFPEHVSRHFGSNPLLDAAVCCIGTEYLRLLTKDPKLETARRRLYSDALRKINQALDTEAVMSEEMLGTIMILTVYEMQVQTTKDAWIQHCRAAKHLFLRREAKAYMSGFLRACYYGFRSFLIAHALSEGEPCFLDEDEWQDLAVMVRKEDSQKPCEWSVSVEVEEAIFMEFVKCPRYLSDARGFTSTTSREEVVSLMQRIRSTCFKLQTHSDELRSCIAAHSQRQQGIRIRPASFVGPMPEVFPVTSASLLLLGCNSAITTLQKLLRAINIDGPSDPATPSAESSSETVSSGSSPQAASSGDSSPRTFSLPFRIVSRVTNWSSDITDENDPQAVQWLDGLCSSMGMLGVDVVSENELNEVEDGSV
ncbi:hypothetical protein VTN77DRAFT_6404 [Rasamsonia byssochlamydoides]|uniref:uncharacterized protein n=1 Tax=Rasamsonia byssochlamydoides TaxID=89139 RepID=UPI0037420C1D